MRKHDEKKLSRARALFARKNGATVAEVAASVSTSQRSVERWLRMWGSTKGTTVVQDKRKGATVDVALGPVEGPLEGERQGACFVARLFE